MNWVVLFISLWSLHRLLALSTRQQKTAVSALVRQRVGVAGKFNETRCQTEVCLEVIPATCYHCHSLQSFSFFVSFKSKDKQHYSQQWPAGPIMHNGDWCYGAERDEQHLDLQRAVVAFIRPAARQPSGSRLLTSGRSYNGWTGCEANLGQRIVIFINDIPLWSYTILSPKASICLLA